MTGQVHSIQSLGTLDGPGVRFVVFTQGCNLRCGCCHNPDTWGSGGTEYEPKAIAEKAARYKEYFGKNGGITVSGGEPLLQTEFVTELFKECKALKINTCLDTSGSIINDKTEALLEVTDRVLLDIKYTSDEEYEKYVGCSLTDVLCFLKLLEKHRIPTTLRQVIIPTLNDNKDNILMLKTIADKHKNVDQTELLPFRKLCSVKYDSLGIKFPFGDLPEADTATVKELEGLLK